MFKISCHLLSLFMLPLALLSGCASQAISSSSSYSTGANPTIGEVLTTLTTLARTNSSTEMPIYYGFGDKYGNPRFYATNSQELNLHRDEVMAEIERLKTGSLKIGDFEKLSVMMDQHWVRLFVGIENRTICDNPITVEYNLGDGSVVRMEFTGKKGEELLSSAVLMNKDGSTTPVELR